MILKPMRHSLFYIIAMISLSYHVRYPKVHAFSNHGWRRTIGPSSIATLQRAASTIDDASSDPLNSIPDYMDPSSFPDWAYESRDYFRYELVYQSTKSMARVGRIHTPHGIIDTPGYVAVATNGALKVRMETEIIVGYALFFV